MINNTNRAVLIYVIIFQILIFCWQSYAFAISNKLVDLTVYHKNNVKTIELRFAMPINRRDWRIKFHGKYLNIELHNIVNSLNEKSLNINSQEIDNISISQADNATVVSILFKKNVNQLISNGNIGFLTKHKGTLGILLKGFTSHQEQKETHKEIIDNIVDNKVTLERDKVGKNDKQKAKKTNNPSKPKTEAKSSNEGLKLPSINYEDILSNPYRKDKNITKHKLDRQSNRNIIPNILEQSVNQKNNDSHRLGQEGKDNDLSGFNDLPLVTHKVYNRTSDNKMDIFKVITSLCIVVGLILLTLFFWKRLLIFRFKGLNNNGGAMKIMFVHHFSPRQSVALVQIYGERFLLGLTPENITLLAKLGVNESEDVAGMHLKQKDTDINIKQKRPVELLREKIAQLQKV